MSLLDDVSLMITPNGVSKNVLFGALPQPIIGENILLNPTFDTSIPMGDNGSGWSSDPDGGTSVATFDSGGGKIFYDGTNTSRLRARTSGGSQNVMTIGTTYKLVYEVIENNNVSTFRFSAPSTVINNSVGTHTYYFTATTQTFQFFFGNGSNGDYIIVDNVYLKPYTSADMDFTRATSATRVNPSGKVDGVTTGLPRLDYRINESCPHVLVEPQRTNICLRSQQINESSWSKSNVTVTANSTISPENITNAEKVARDGVDANDRVEQTITVSNSTTYTISAFFKNNDNPTGGKTTLAFRVSGGTLFRKGYEWTGSALAATTSFASGTRTNEFIEDYGNNWYRVGFSFTSDGTSGEIEIDVDRSGGTSTTSIYLWGCQLEQGGYKTSYIETTSLSVTRNQELFTRTGIADLINTTEGVLFIEMAALADDGTTRQISLSDGTNNNRVTIGLSNSSDTVSAQVKNGSLQMNKTNAMTQTDFNKIALKWKENDMALWLNGTEVETDLSGTTPSALNELSFQRGDDTNYFYGKIRQLQVYKTALSDTQLGDLTT